MSELVFVRRDSCGLHEDIITHLESGRYAAASSLIAVITPEYGTVLVRERMQVSELGETRLGREVRHSGKPRDVEDAK